VATAEAVCRSKVQAEIDRTFMKKLMKECDASAGVCRAFPNLASESERNGVMCATSITFIT
jgi:hypothetical protein